MIEAIESVKSSAVDTEAVGQSNLESVSQLDGAHEDFINKMGGADVEERLTLSSEKYYGGQGLSDRLFSFYNDARAQRAEKLNAVAEMFQDDSIMTADKMLDAQMKLSAEQNKGSLAIKATEKALESFNSLLRMQ